LSVYGLVHLNGRQRVFLTIVLFDRLETRVTGIQNKKAKSLIAHYCPYLACYKFKSVKRFHPLTDLLSPPYFRNLFVARSNAYYGPGTGTVWLDDVTCNGDEASVVDCRHNPWGISNCNHDEDVSVDCDPSKHDLSSTFYLLLYLQLSV